MKLFTISLILSGFVLLTGCASLPLGKVARKTKTPETPQTFAQRKKVAVVAFERQRDAAQVQAAINHWQRGDQQKCLSLLHSIIERAPADVNARLRMAEVLTAKEDFAGAEVQLRECLVHAPNSAEAHHNLGMLLTEAPGREAEAQQHLRRAFELEPKNELYGASAK